MKKNVVIVHYNTPNLTRAAVLSILKHTPDCNIAVFDNSTVSPFVPMDGVEIYDNTKGQIINFDKLFEKYPERRPTCCNWGSEKHIASVDYFFDIFTDGFVLMDSDVLVKRDISEFFDPSVAWVGTVDYRPSIQYQGARLLPFLLWVNVPMCKEHNIRFFHEGYVYMVSHHGPPYYDTGGSLYKDCKDAGLPFNEIRIEKYIEHLGGSSFKPKGEREKQWLKKFRHLYMDAQDEKSYKDKILVVIPFCSEGAQGKELEYAVAGWRKHFQEDYLIVLAGENHPITKTGDDIICIESKRVPPRKGMYRQHLDYVSCFRKVHAAFPDSKGFIFVADDCYAVNDFDMSDIKLLKQVSPDMRKYNGFGNGWEKDKARTRELLVREGYPTRNFTTHLPQWFEWDKLEALWDKYDMDNNSYVFEDLYYNIYYSDRVPLQLHIDFDNFKCGVYRANPRMSYIEKAFKNKIWIQNSVEGWIPALDKILSDYYGV